MAECFYCGTDEKLTRAHLFHQRIREVLANESEGLTLASSSVRSGGVERDLLRPGDVREMNVKILCVRCNSRWMEPIEKAAAPVLGSIMRGIGVPPPRDLFRLAHWSIVVGALATQTGTRFDVPVEHRRQIRFTATGQPQYFGTHFIWTLDTYPGVQFDYMRFDARSEAGERGVSWYSALHAGPLVMVSAEFVLNTMIARELHHSGIESYLGTVSSNLVCIPEALRTGRRQSAVGSVSPSHGAVQELYRKVAGPDVEYVPTHASSLASMDEWKEHPSATFDYGDTLVDMRSELDLSYLDGVFEP
ncbi:hypothetical protein [Nocardia ignorata]|uniref:HNH endonuclease n=1 Tax=Nocardia ignorata TaxID=145285 RepID=A0A4R6P1W3_NOCIG|nr:hypothetical protein [Nocardia ignorata]TDP31471.1 hypothetical protein DFR75_10876 [Nocardia ignorata]